MVKILLLDDSPTMQRVVTLTFADEQQVEIFVARDRSEADQCLSTEHIDLIIAYVRFDGLSDSRYFEGLSSVVPRIILLAEGEENLEPLTRAGFRYVLRKPFNSDELRQMADRILDEEVLPVEKVLSVERSPATERGFGSNSQREKQGETKKGVTRAQEPPVTLDLSFLQMNLESKTQSSSRSAPSVRESFQLRTEASLKTPAKEFPDDEATVSQKFVPAEKSRGISAEFNNLTRKDVEYIVEQSVAVAVNRAVRQALNETLPDLRQTIVVEVSRRAVEQLNEELGTVKKTLREQMLSEIREMSSQWLRKETPNFAKDVIREEIRRVIEQI